MGYTLKGKNLLQAIKKGVTNGVAHEGVPIHLLKRHLFCKNAVWMRKFNITLSPFLSIRVCKDYAVVGDDIDSLL